MVNEEFRVRIFLVGITEKCFHAAMEMFNENSGVVSAVCEQITMNVDLTLRKSNKYPDWVREKFDLMIKSQKGKPLPSQIGKSLALKS
jgi:acyl-CoA thioesterase FadM